MAYMSSKLTNGREAWLPGWIHGGMGGGGVVLLWMPLLAVYC